MKKIELSRDVEKFLPTLPSKHKKQLVTRILELRINAVPHDARPLKGTAREYYRIDAGEYRIIYLNDDDALRVVLIGKRNDGEVYRRLKRRE